MNYLNLNEKVYKDTVKWTLTKDALSKTLILLLNIVQLLVFYNMLINISIVKVIITIVLTILLFALKHAVVGLGTFNILREEGFEVGKPNLKSTILVAFDFVKDMFKKPLTILTASGCSLVLPSMILITKLYEEDGINSNTRQKIFMEVRGGKSCTTKTVTRSMLLFLFTHIVPIIIVVIMKGKPSTTFILTGYAIIFGLLASFLQILEPLMTFQKIKGLDAVAYEEKLENEKNERERVKEDLNEYGYGEYDEE